MLRARRRHREDAGTGAAPGQYTNNTHNTPRGLSGKAWRCPQRHFGHTSGDTSPSLCRDPAAASPVPSCPLPGRRLTLLAVVM